MIVVDTSVVVAIMRAEHDAAVWVTVLDQSPRSYMSVVTYVETNMVMMGRRFRAQMNNVERTLESLHVTVVPVTLDEGSIARTAFIRFGKGRHSAALNLADCFAYALAKRRNLPLLFKGDDFAKTDIVPAWLP
jgi:ribonuclease VapC